MLKAGFQATPGHRVAYTSGSQRVAGDGVAALIAS